MKVDEAEISDVIRVGLGLAFWEKGSLGVFLT